MTTLISKNNFNIFINEETGKWFSFNHYNKSGVYKDIDIETIKRKFSNYSELVPYLEIINNSKQPQNRKLNDMNYLILHVSDACNMNCLYCYAEDNMYNNKCNKMSSETMIKAILKFYKDKDFFVLFHGREPLTNYNNIIKTLEYFKEYKKIHFILQTNGLLLNDRIVKELRNYNVTINVSIDGISDYNNIFRINNSNIKYTDVLLEKIKKYHISPIIIVHKNNYKDLTKITRYLINNGITNASYNFLWPTKNNHQLNDYVVPPKQLFREMKSVFNLSIENNNFVFKERDMYLLYGRILKRDIFNYMCNSSPCGAGKNCLSIYKDGLVYPCTMVNNQKENYLGKLIDSVDSLLNKDVVIKTRNINKIEGCSSCPFRIFCKGGGCCGFIYNLTGDINAKSLYCDYYYNMIIYIMNSIHIMSKKKYFVNY